MKIRMIHCPKAADLELPATDPANAPVPCRIQTGHLPAGSSPFARNAEAQTLLQHSNHEYAVFF
jgi:hypothetical protein